MYVWVTDSLVLLGEIEMARILVVLLMRIGTIYAGELVSGLLKSLVK